MTIAGTISSVLANKQSPASAWCVTPDNTVFEAIQMMADKNVGALMVMENNHLVGIISERDYTRKVALKGKASKDTKVREIITSQLIHVTPSHTVDECMRLMTSHRIRHLPVLEGDKVLGLVSIGDLVNWIIGAQSQAISQLQRYIQGHMAP